MHWIWLQVIVSLCATVCKERFISYPQEKTDEEALVWGAFLQEEIEKIGWLGSMEGCLNCRCGK